VEAKYLELSSEPVTVVRAWLSCWKNRNLLIRGQVVLIKSVSFALPVYYHFFFHSASSCLGNCGVEGSI